MDVWGRLTRVRVPTTTNVPCVCMCVFARAQVDEKAMDARKRRGRHQPGTASGAAGAVAANQAILSRFEKQMAAAEKQVMYTIKLHLI